MYFRQNFTVQSLVGIGRSRYAWHMKIIVQVKTNAKIDEIKLVDDRHYMVRLHAPPIQGKANEALVKLLSNHFDLSSSRIRIISGFSSRMKIIEID